ncbi:PREDICTED: uncharacterized protein LOC109211810 [Nicotiana attenuata]|uniref:uncharacterized protein LOC109211810 n=1 Tax=Nicotiana attenuata TaxID=49451 RepID=UPI0009052FBE|nr:PREDICTED: uncharacterized protein LOC109211810 [Nicotiana attenuata]
MDCITTVQYTIAVNGGLYGNIKGERGLRQGDPISPLLFVICMEYFTRIMNVVAQQEGFGYHTKCKSLKLNPLCFADDVLLFSKGDFQSVHLLLRGLKTFSERSGLTTNASKSNIFGVNMPVQSQKDLMEMTGYQKGNLPFGYLGVPISAKRLSKMDYEIFMDKIAARIKGWGTRHLSYAGRVQLVNSVLLHLHSYWSTIFLLPKQVIKGITAMYMNFIWDGEVVTHKPSLVAWDLVCRTKQEGGLGITDIIKWNEAAIAKYIWNIAQKADNLWVKRINSVYLKEKNWWQYKCPNDACWYWKKICIIREVFAPGFNQNLWRNANGQYTIKEGYIWRMGERKNWPWRRYNRDLEENDQINQREELQGSCHCYTGCPSILDMEG